MRKRTWISLAVVVAILAALAVTVYLRKKAPPEVARLLPEADAIIYFNVKPLRALTHFDRHPVAHDPAYQAFIDATGIEFERDLDRAAFAIHRRANPDGPNGPVAYSEIFRGHFSGTRLAAYLQTESTGVERYAGHDVYSISHEERTVRVAILGYNFVAVSNTPTAEQIHSIIDRYQSAASPFSGSTLLSKYYSQVPLLSEAWGIGQLGLPFASGEQIHIFGFPVPLPINATFIASARYLKAIHLRLEEIAPSTDAAGKSVRMANFSLGLLRSAQMTATPQDENAKEWGTLLHNTKVEQKGNRAILNVVVPISLLRSLLSPKKSDATLPETNPPQADR